MGKTKRNASRWMETRFKWGDPLFPEGDAEFFNGRYQNKVRNENRSYYSTKIDPLSYRVVSSWGYSNWAKPLAKRAARHNAKLLIIKLTHIILDEVWQEEQTQMWGDDEDMIGFDFSYSDEAFDYAERRRLEELEDEQEQRDWWSTYDPYEDWDY